MVRMCGVGGASGGEGVLVVELGHVVDMFRKDEMTKMVGLIGVRSYFFHARLLLCVETNTFDFSSGLYGHSSPILWKAL
jgi:hypothetical protein